MKKHNPKVSLKSDIYLTDKSPPTHGLKRHALTIFNRENKNNFFLFILIQYKQFGVYSITTCTIYNWYEVMTFKVYIGPIYTQDIEKYRDDDQKKKMCFFFSSRLTKYLRFFFLFGIYA